MSPSAAAIRLVLLTASFSSLVGCERAPGDKNVPPDRGTAVQPLARDSASPTHDQVRVAAADDESTDALCEAVRTKPFPMGDLPTPAERASVQAGESYRHYYGIGTPVDYVRARHGAFVELEQGDEAVFGGSAILMMLYSNGFGVQRDLEQAIKLACSNGFAPAEREGRVRRLNAMKRAPGDTTFDFCDDVTSGYMAGHCDGLAEERKSALRERELEALVRNWPDEHLAALVSLRRAVQGFSQARTSGELDLSGTDRSSQVIAEEARLKQELVDAIRSFEQGKLPAYTAEDYRHADAELNRVYALALARDYSGTTIEVPGIKRAEKAWLKYRDAWVALGILRYPSVSPDAWKTWATLERVRHLAEL